MPILSIFLAFVVIMTVVVGPFAVLKLVYELKTLVEDIKDLIDEIKYGGRL